jgi:hypothetical protein
VKRDKNDRNKKLKSSEVELSRLQEEISKLNNENEAFKDDIRKCV